jgi:large subunit ribosomal protein L20
MPRVKRGTKRKERRTKYLKMAKGYWGAKSRLYKSAKESVERALSFAYRDRRTKKRDFRRLWIIRIGAAARLNGLSYSRFINGLTKAGVVLDRKVLAEMAVKDPAGFAELATLAQESVNSSSS